MENKIEKFEDLKIWQDSVTIASALSDL